MCVRIINQLLSGLSKTTRSVVYRYTPEGLLISQEEGISKESTDWENAVVFEPLGELVTEGFGDRYQWDSPPVETETALIYNRARCYDPTPGRWLNSDPLAFDGGEGNLYPYPTTETTQEILPSE